MLTSTQREEFEQSGLLCIPGAIPGRDAESMCSRVWQELEKHRHIRRDDAQTWPLAPSYHLNYLSRLGAFAAMASPAVVEILDELLGPSAWERPGYWGGLLVTFPNPQSEWC